MSQERLNGVSGGLSIAKASVCSGRCVGPQEELRMASSRDQITRAGSREKTRTDHLCICQLLSIYAGSWARDLAYEFSKPGVCEVGKQRCLHRLSQPALHGDLPQTYHVFLTAVHHFSSLLTSKRSSKFVILAC